MPEETPQTVNLSVRTGSDPVRLQAVEAHTPPDEAIMELRVEAGEETPEEGLFIRVLQQPVVKEVLSTAHIASCSCGREMTFGNEGSEDFNVA